MTASFFVVILFIFCKISLDFLASFDIIAKSGPAFAPSLLKNGKENRKVENLMGCKGL